MMNGPVNVMTVVMFAIPLSPLSPQKRFKILPYLPKILPFKVMPIVHIAKEPNISVTILVPLLVFIVMGLVSEQS